MHDRAMGKSTGAFAFDTRADPLHLQVIPLAFTWSEMDAHFSEMEAFYTGYVRRHPRCHVGLLADAREIPYVDARMRKRIAESFEYLGKLLSPERSVAHAVITANALTRGALTAILWLNLPPWQIKVFTSMHDGDAWLRSTFAAHGFTAPNEREAWWRDAGAAG